MRNLRLLVCVALALFTASTYGLAAENVGFEEIHIAYGTEAPLVGGIWYPTDVPGAERPLGLPNQIVADGAPVAGSRLPLVVLSHGGGGSYESNYDTALALAHAGFVAAAISHSGDTYDDSSQVLKLWRRPAQLRRLVSYMLEEWPDHDRLDKSRVGAFGYSNGGFTVLVTAGGIPNLSRTGAYCKAHPDHDLCLALKKAGVDPGLVGRDAPSGAWAADARVKAVVVVAPAFGFAFGRGGLKDVHIPVQLWRAAEDHHQPNPGYEEAVRLALPRPPEYHVVPGAGHYDFLPSCGARLATIRPEICADPSGFDRVGFHQEFNAAIVRFFRASLR